MTIFCRTLTCLVIHFTVSALVVTADDREALRFFETSIRPLLSSECYECHGPEKSKGGLRLDHREFILEGGETGPALVAGDPG